MQTPRRGWAFSAGKRRSRTRTRVRPRLTDRSHRGGARQDRLVVSQHRCRAVVIIVSEPVADQRSARIDGRGKIVPLHKSRLTAVRRSGLPLVPSLDGRGSLAAAGYSDSRFVARLFHKAEGLSPFCMFVTRSPFATESSWLRSSRSVLLRASHEVGGIGGCGFRTTAWVCETASRPSGSATVASASADASAEAGAD